MSGPWLRALALTAFELSLWAVAAGLARITRVPLGFADGNLGSFVAALLVGTSGFAAFAWLEGSGWSWLQRIRSFLEHTARPLFAGMGPVTLGIVAAAAGIGEESLFRGWLQSWLETKFDPLLACALTALLFGAAHPISWGYAVLAALLGLALGALRMFSGGWLAPAIAHGLYDALALWWLFCRDSPSAKKAHKKI